MWGFLIFMIAKIPLSQRPVFTCTKENWLRNIETISSDGEYIYYRNEKIGFDDLVNLTSTVGAVAYAYKKDNVWLIFDFSSSHLCHNQIKAAILELLCNYS